MAKYVLSNKAVEDLSAIWEYTLETWSEAQAEKYYYLLLDACQGLADGSLSGRAYPEAGPDICGFRSGRHILFYKKVKDNGVMIVRILHEQMDLKNRARE